MKTAFNLAWLLGAAHNAALEASGGIYSKTSKPPRGAGAKVVANVPREIHEEIISSGVKPSDWLRHLISDWICADDRTWLLEAISKLDSKDDDFDLLG